MKKERNIINACFIEVTEAVKKMKGFQKRVEAIGKIYFSDYGSKHGKYR